MSTDFDFFFDDLDDETYVLETAPEAEPDFENDRNEWMQWNLERSFSDRYDRTNTVLRQEDLERETGFFLELELESL